MKLQIAIIILLLFAGTISGQDKTKVFFSIDDTLNNLSTEIEDMIDTVGNEPSVRSRLNEFLYLILSDPKRGPINLSNSYACSPWIFLGKIWPKISETLKKEIMVTILEKLSKSSASHASPLTGESHLPQKIFFSIPDPLLRKKLGPAIAQQSLEAGDLSLAESCFKLLSGITTDAERLPILRGQIAASLLNRAVSTGNASNSNFPVTNDPGLEQYIQKVQSEVNDTNFSPIVEGPWKSSWHSASPGTLKKRFNDFPQIVSDLEGSKSTRFAHFPVAVNKNCYVFNGEKTLAISLQENKLLWKTDLPGSAPQLRNTILAPAVNNSCVFVAANGKIACLNSVTGSIIWCIYYAKTGQQNPGWETTLPVNTSPISLTPPLLASGKLLIGSVCADINQTVSYLSAFSPNNGALLWQTKIGTTQTTDFLGLGSSPLPLAYKRGRVFFLPNMGLIAAVDIKDGSIDYIKTYPRLRVLAEKDSLERQTFWHLSPPVFSGNNLIAAPQDTKEIIGINIIDGGLFLRIPKGDADYFLGPVKDRLFLVGKTLKSVSLSKTNFSQILFEIPLISKPYGRGQIINEMLVIPFKDTLLFFSTDDGKVLSTHLWEIQGGGGNILATKWGIVVSNRKEIDLYRDLNEELVDMQLQLFSFHSNIRHLITARYALKTKEFTKALDELEAYRKSSEKYISPNETRERRERIHVGQLLDTWIKLDIPIAIKLKLCEYRADLAVNDKDAVSSLVAQGKLQLQLGNIEKAIDAYYSALSQAKDVSITVPWGLTVKAVPYIKGKIQNILKNTKSKEAVLQKYSFAAAKELQYAKDARAVPVYLSLIRRYPFTPAGQEAIIDCAQIYLANQNSLAAKDLLTNYYNQNPNGIFAHLVLIFLGKIYEAGEQINEAYEVYKLVGMRFPDKKIKSKGKEVLISYWVKHKLSQLSSFLHDTQPTRLRLPLRLKWLTRSDLLDRAASLHIAGNKGDPENEYFILSGEEFLRVYEMKTGILRNVFKIPDHFQGAGFIKAGSGKVLVASGRNTISGFQMTKTDPVFNVSVSKPGNPQTYIQDFSCLHDRIICLSDKNLFCFNSSGKQLWKTLLPRRCRKPILDGGDFTTAFSSFGPLVFFINNMDGSICKTLKFDINSQRLNLQPVPAGKNSVIVTYGHDLFLVNLQQQKLSWHKHLKQISPSKCCYLKKQPKMIYAWGQAEKGKCLLIALNFSDGSILWEKDFPPDLFITEMVSESRDNLTLLCGHTVQEVIELTIDGDKIKQKWRRRLYKKYGETVPLFVSGGSIFHGNLITNQVVALSSKTGIFQDESMGPVRHFLNKRLLLEYKLYNDSLYVLTENGIGCFQFFDQYRREETKESLINAALNSNKQAVTYFQLGNYLLTHGMAGKALHFLDKILWSKWPQPENSERLWQLLGAAQEESAQQNVCIVDCFPAPKDIKIDGFLNEKWPLKSAIKLNRPYNLTPIQGPDNLVPTWEGPEDLSATFFSAWDEKNFYFAFKIRDNMIIPHDSSADKWIGDCLIVTIDPEGDGGLFHTKNDVIFSLFLSVRNQPKKGNGKNPPGVFKIRVTNDRAGIIYECALPWDFFGRTEDVKKFEKPVYFGFNLIYVDDDDGHGARQSISINSGHPLGWNSKRVWETFIPSYSPKILLRKN